MGSFILDVLNTQGKPMATLSITAGNGTKADGFGWDWFGAGFNTGGKWEWLLVDDPDPTIAGWSIVLRDTDGNIFGFVNANWDPLPNPNGFPPEPWFDQKGINSGEVTVVVKGPSQTANWRLR